MLRVLGGFLWVVGGIALLAIDVASSSWLAAEHGFGWVIASWVFVAPLFVIPYLAGYGWLATGAMALMLIGAAITARE